MYRKIKNITVALSGLALISFLDGFLNLGFGDDFYALVGLGLIIGIGWMLYIVNTKEFNQLME